MGTGGQVVGRRSNDKKPEAKSIELPDDEVLESTGILHDTNQKEMWGDEP